MIEQENTQIQFVNKEKDNGAMTRAIQKVYDLTLEIDSAREGIKAALTDGFDVYKEKIDDTAKKGEYNAFIKSSVDDMINDTVSKKIEKLENIKDHIDIMKKNINR